MLNEIPPSWNLKWSWITVPILANFPKYSATAITDVRRAQYERLSLYLRPVQNCICSYGYVYLYLSPVAKFQPPQLQIWRLPSMGEHWIVFARDWSMSSAASIPWNCRWRVIPMPGSQAEGRDGSQRGSFCCAWPTINRSRRKYVDQLIMRRV